MWFDVKSKNSWLLGPVLFVVALACLLVTWAAMDPAAVAVSFDNDGRSPFELATLPFFAAIIPLVWWKNPFEGSSRRRRVLALMVTVVAAMAILKQLDLHCVVLRWFYPDCIGADGSLVQGRFCRPDGRPLNGTPFKMRVITNGEVPFGMKALIVGYFTLFFGLFAAGFIYLFQFWVDGVVKFKPSSWAWGCFGASGVLVQVADRLPSWLGHGYGLSSADGGVTKSRALCTVLEEGGEMMLAGFALLTIYLAWKELQGAAATACAAKPGAKTVLFWGRFDHGYSRNRVNIALFGELGWNVEFFDVKISPRFGDIEAFLRGLSRRVKPDLVWVPVCRQRDIMAACRWARRNGAKVLFDPMISAWDKKVLEQKKWRADEPRAKKLHAAEKKLMHAPDFVTWDTSCHVDFCEREYAVPREKMAALFTGTDEKIFKPGATPAREGSDFRVLYHGAYIPLHGMEYIVEAARMTEGKGIHWDLLGWGAYKASTEAMAKGISNITFLDKVPYEKVPEVIYKADVVLGVFGTTEKASRVIGNKIFEAMGCARPVINEFCTGYPPEAANCKAIKFVPAGDAAAIVKAVEEYRADWTNRESYNEAAYEFFKNHLSMAEVKKQLVAILARLVPSTH